MPRSPTVHISKHWKGAGESKGWNNKCCITNWGHYDQKKSQWNSPHDQHKLLIALYLNIVKQEHDGKSKEKCKKSCEQLSREILLSRKGSNCFCLQNYISEISVLSGDCTQICFLSLINSYNSCMQQEVFHTLPTFSDSDTSMHKLINICFYFLLPFFLLFMWF